MSIKTLGVAATAYVCVIDAMLVDTSLSRGACAITRDGILNGVARLEGFASVGGIIVAVVVSELADARFVGAEHVVAARVVTGATMFAVAREIGADAGVTSRKFGSASHDAFVVLAGFMVFARLVAVTAIFRVALDIDTIAVAPFLGGGAGGRRSHAVAVKTDLVRTTFIPQGATVLRIRLKIEAKAIDAGFVAAAARADGVAGFAAERRPA